MRIIGVYVTQSGFRRAAMNFWLHENLVGDSCLC